MSIQTIAKQFVELCNQGKNFDVMRTMYDPNIVSVEGDGTETAGQTPVIQKSERWAAANTIHGEKVRGPFFNGAGEFAVHFTFEVTPKATGQRRTLEEVGVYTVKGDKITRERFCIMGRGRGVADGVALPSGGPEGSGTVTRCHVRNRRRRSHLPHRDWVYWSNRANTSFSRFKIAMKIMKRSFDLVEFRG